MCETLCYHKYPIDGEWNVCSPSIESGKEPVGSPARLPHIFLDPTFKIEGKNAARVDVWNVVRDRWLKEAATKHMHVL
jgi:hypothetical protein